MAFRCKYMEGCPMYNYLTTSVRIIELQPYVEEYCLNEEHHRECARYKKRAQGKVPPDNLLPNGTALKA
jgi:hypothetical protein